jgi:hypothetical protein
MWKAHFSQVEGLCFSPSNTVLASSGIDLKPAVATDESVQLSPEEQEKMPRLSSVVLWDLERWIMVRMKSR